MKLAPLFLLLTLASAAVHAAEDDQWNILVDPIVMLLGPNAQLDYRLDDHWTVGPQVFFINRKIGDYDIHAFSLGMNGTYYFNKAFTHSWYTQGGIGYSTTHVEETEINGDLLKANGSGVFVKGFGGYHWFWGDFNLRLGGGLVVNSGRTELHDQNGRKVKDGPLAPVNLGIDATLGWTF